ncbi:Bacteriophage T4 gp9/10-like protein [compost metagenome]
MSKDLINTGVAGDSTTGDNLFTGGNKVNQMFEEIYNAFGKQGANPQIIHASGYWQTPSRSSYTFPIAAGSQISADTRNGSLVVKLPNGKVGEMVRIRDIYGSWTNSPITVRPDGLEKIDGMLGDQVFGIAYTELTFVCIQDDVGSVNWTYSLRLMNERELRLIDNLFVLTPSTPVTYVIGPTDLFVAAKLLISGRQTSGGTSVTSSEIHLAHDGITNVYTESSVLGTGITRVYDVDFSIQSGNVLMTLSTTLAQAKVQVRSTDFTKFLI